MAQDVLVNEQIEGGRELLDQLAAEGIEVTVAFWAKETESGWWYLFIASPVVDERGIAAAYGAIIEAARNTPHQWIEPLEVKLLRSADVMAVTALRLVAPVGPNGTGTAHPSAARRTVSYYDVGSLGGVGVDGVYLYRPRHPAPAA